MFFCLCYVLYVIALLSLWHHCTCLHFVHWISWLCSCPRRLHILARIFQVMEKRPEYIRYFKGGELQERVSTVERFLDEIDEKNQLNRGASKKGCRFFLLFVKSFQIHVGSNLVPRPFLSIKTFVCKKLKRKAKNKKRNIKL